MLQAPPGVASTQALVDRQARVVAETPDGRVVLVSSMSFAAPEHRRDVLCAGSHGGRVNVQRPPEGRPRGAALHHRGPARDRPRARGPRAPGTAGGAGPAGPP